MTLTTKLRSSGQRRHRQRGIGRLDPSWDARPINWRGPGVDHGSGHDAELCSPQNIELRSPQNIEPGSPQDIGRGPECNPGVERPSGNQEPVQQVVEMRQGVTPKPPDYAGQAQQADAPADRKIDAGLEQMPHELRIAVPQANRPGDRIAAQPADNPGGRNGDRTDTGLGAPEKTGGNRAKVPMSGIGATTPPVDRTGICAQTGNRAAILPSRQGEPANPFAPGLIAPGSAAPGPVAQDRSLTQSRQKLIDDLRVMKRTRFNAQARFEAKHTASVSAFTLATIVEIGLSLLGSNFGAGLSADVVSFIDYASQVTAVFILGFGLVVALAGHQTKALYLQRCAKDWGNLSREMQIAGPIGRADLQDYRRRYHEIEGRCPPNHADVDLDKARLDKSDRKAVRDNKLDYLINVYLSYAFSGLALSAFWVALWHFMVA